MRGGRERRGDEMRERDEGAKRRNCQPMKFGIQNVLYLFLRCQISTQMDK